MPNRLSIDPQALRQAATTVTGSGDDLATNHDAASSRISSAGLGWTGRSAGALSVRATEWAARNKALQVRIQNHANNIRTTAAEFARADDTHSTMLHNPPNG